MSEDKGTAALSDDMPTVGEGSMAAPVHRAAPRLQQAVGNQVELRACDLEPLLAPPRCRGPPTALPVARFSSATTSRKRRPTTLSSVA